MKKKKKKNLERGAIGKYYTPSDEQFAGALRSISPLRVGMGCCFWPGLFIDRFSLRSFGQWNKNDAGRVQKGRDILTNVHFTSHIENHLDSVIVRGSAFPFDNMQNYLRTRSVNLTVDYRARDITGLFYDISGPCAGYPAINPTSAQCSVPNPYSNTSLIAKPCLTFSDLNAAGPRSTGRISFHWTDLDDRSRRDLDNVILYDGRSKWVTRGFHSPHC